MPTAKKIDAALKDQLANGVMPRMRWRNVTSEDVKRMKEDKDAKTKC